MSLDLNKLSALLNKGLVIKQYPFANMEQRKKKLDNGEWVDYYIVWPFKAKESIQPLSHAYSESDAWKLAAKRIEL